MKQPTRVDAWCCVHCSQAWLKEQAAIECCARTCEECGAEYAEKVNWVVCKPCRAKRIAARRERKPRIDPKDWGDAVVIEGGDYYDSLEDLWDEADAETAQRVPYVYPTIKVELAKRLAADLADGIIETVLQDHHDDAYGELVDVEGLTLVIQGWLDSQSLVSWQEDSSRVIWLDDSFWEEGS